MHFASLVAGTLTRLLRFQVALAGYAVVRVVRISGQTGQVFPIKGDRRFFPLIFRRSAIYVASKYGTRRVPTGIAF